MIYCEVRDKNNEVIITTVKNFAGYEDILRAPCKNLRQKTFKSEYRPYKDNSSIWLIVDGDTDLINSSRLFAKTMTLYKDMAKYLFDSYLDKIRTHAHTLRTIQGKMKQKIDSLATRKDFRAKSYKKSKEKISKLISENLDKTSDIICQLNKRVAEIDAHIEGFDVLYLGDKSNFSKKQVDIKKVILNITTPFLLDFQNKGVKIIYSFKDKYSLDNKVEINYKLFNLAYCNFLDNAIKYTLPDSQIVIDFNKKEDKFQIKIKMMSLRIDSDEIERIFDQGYSGRHAEADAGDGIGMSVIKKSLELMGLDIKINFDYSKSAVLDGRKYVENTFLIHTT